MQHLIGMECLGYVEWERYCCRVLEQRIKDGFLSPAPVFCGDIRQWIKQGYASAYSGLVDLVTAGFPCQPFSSSGLRLGVDDPRNMWPATIEGIRIIRPKFALLENVPGILTNGYFGTVLGDLASAGYDAKWDVFSACEKGAPHTRERLFIVAYAKGERCGGRRFCGDGTQGIGKGKTTVWAFDRTTNPRCSQVSIWDQPISEAVRMDDGIPGKLDRIKATGNAQVPFVAATAWSSLIGSLVW